MKENKDNIYGIIRKDVGLSDNRVVEFVASDATRDSYGTVVNPQGWDLERFKKNPIIAYGHRTSGSDNIDNIVGKGDARVEGDQLIVTVTFEPEGINEKADKVYAKLMFGSLNAVSVGFIAKGGHWGEGDEALTGDDPTYYYDGQELLEVSVVPIPANPNAVKKSFPEELENEISSAVNAEKKQAQMDKDSALLTLAKSYE